MKINVKELKVGDVFTYSDDTQMENMLMVLQNSKVFKVMEISEMPLYTMNFEKVYPIMCDCFSPEKGKTFGYMKLADAVEEVELLYRENEAPYKSWTSAIPKEEN